ncbi:hypothetical protein LPJ78_005907 [Coemansia sp. RSA 989]|nr:hypothetical protein BX667DRAFT_495642 [Coemansia mojavensis]KAI9479119.1 hypothetical protein BX667DRAFT_495651 [Coemansia mojavensis]KAJ1738221.1 hypothetical protein LPJ68_005727 [Coemansia sp. RSA 1086]KAJ1746349.1 hypothetical protein LPJ79_005904 [Coemansia sp. RSA 1821]KAJ1860203.1 hypothetical protein LPJ78_005907 [Coemansia sp. RSA 989]
MSALANAARSSLFENEQQRIQHLENLFDMHINPVDGVDTAVIAVCSATFGVTFVFMVIAWLNRNYRPIRAKNLPLTTAMFVSGVLWFVGDIPMNGHVLLKGSFSNCKEWNIWVRVLFCFVYTTAIISRCYALDRVFIQNRPTRGFSYYVPTITLLAFVIVYSIVTEAMSSRLTIGYIADLELCSTTKGYVYVTLSLLWVNWLIIIVMMIRLRNIQSTFNEFYEFLFICAFGIAAMVKTNVVHYTHPKYPLVRGYRVAETVGDVFVINAILLIIMAYPVIMCVWRKEEYEREWLLRLRTDGLQDMYEANLNLRAENPQAYERMNTSTANAQKAANMRDNIWFLDPPRFAEGYPAESYPADFAAHGDSSAMTTLHINDAFAASDDLAAYEAHSPQGHRFSNHSTVSLESSTDAAKARQLL